MPKIALRKLGTAPFYKKIVYNFSEPVFRLFGVVNG